VKNETKNIKDLREGDSFSYDGNIYSVKENQSISTSFNELKVICEGGDGNLRLRKTEKVNITEKKTPKLNKPFRTSGGPKKFSVHVRNSKGNIVKVNFGDPNMEIKRDDPERRKNFRARHNCADKTDKTKAGYWSCKMWEKGKSVSSYLKDDFHDRLKEMIRERKLTKGEIKTRDEIAPVLMDKGDLKPRFGTEEEMAYAIATIRAKKEKTAPRGPNRRDTAESFNRLNTVRNSIRRDLNEEI